MPDCRKKKSFSRNTQEGNKNIDAKHLPDTNITVFNKHGINYFFSGFTMLILKNLVLGTLPLKYSLCKFNTAKISQITEMA